MKQFTTCASVANKFFKVLQRYTKGIRFTTILTILLTLGVGSMWGETVTYTIASTSSVTTSGTEPQGSSAGFKNTYTSNKQQLIANNSMTLTLTNLGGIDISNLTLSMKSNKSAGAGKLSYSTDGGATYTYLVGSASSTVNFSNASWNGSYTQTFTNISKNVTLTNVTQLIIKIEATTNSLYCESFKITYTAAAASTYTVTYDKNGATSGSVPTDATKYNSGATVTVKGNSGNLAKTGYTFAGWNTKADGTGTTYAAETGTFTISSNTTLYAKWTANTYTVTWIVDGETKRTDTGVAYNTSKIAPTVSPVPCGDVIAGWTDAVGGNYEHGTSTLHPGATPSITITSDKTFYAVFADYAD